MPLPTRLPNATTTQTNLVLAPGQRLLRYGRFEIGLSGHPPLPGSHITRDSPPVIFQPLPEQVVFDTEIHEGLPQKMLYSAESCIYCGETRYNASCKSLTEEHIVPEGLGGIYTIGNASCYKCQTNINHYEARLQRVMLLDVRRKLGLKRKKRRRIEPDFSPILTKIDGKEVMINLPVEEHPSFLLLPFYFPPGLLSFDVPKVYGPRGPWMHGFTSVENSKYLSAAASIQTPLLDFLAFTQLLAKIAHGYAVTKLGINWTSGEPTIGSFHCLLTAMITRVLKQNDDIPQFYDYVGEISNGVAYKAGTALHQLGMIEIRFGTLRYLGVHIRLFANLAGPVYLVLVGRNVPSTLRG